MAKKVNNYIVPQHVGVIMDGNRRWAKRRLLPASSGHKFGLDRMIGLCEKAKACGVKYLTAYALSTENLNRTAEELDKLFSLIRDNFNSCIERLIKGGAAVKVIGNLSLLPADVREIVEEGVKRSPEEADFTFIMALCYGGREEIVNAANRATGVVTEKSFSSLLYTGGVPDPEFIIRTGGEKRLSNFLLWQSAYAELYFTDVLFPDFSDEEFEAALEDYSKRARHFGK